MSTVGKDEYPRDCDKTDGLLFANNEVVGDFLLVDMSEKTIVGDFAPLCIDEFVQFVVLLHRFCEGKPSVNESIDVFDACFDEFHVVNGRHIRLN